MKTVRYIAFSALAAAGIALSACQPEQYWKDSAEKTGGKVTFTLANKTIEYTYKPEDQMDVVGLEVTRNTSTGVDTLFFKTACSAKDSTFVSCDNFAVFADGKNVATLDFKILQEFDLGQSAPVSVIFADTTKVSPSGVFQATFKITRDYSWTAFEKKGMIVDYMIPFEDEKPTEVVFEQADQNPNIYRIVDAYAEGVAYKKGSADYLAGPDKYLKIQLLHPGDKVGKIDITREGLVYFSEYQTGWYHSTYLSEVKLNHPYDFTMFAGEPITETTGRNSFVESYQKDGKTPELISLAPIYYMDGVGGFDNTGYTEVVAIAFPGCKIKDFGVAVEYTGYTKNAYDEESIGVKISSVGADVDSIKIAYGLKGHEALANEVAAGAIPTFDVTEGGEYQIPIDSLETGKYTIVAMTFNKAEEGVPAEAQSYDYDVFTFTAGGGKLPYLDRDYTPLDLNASCVPEEPEGFVGIYNYYARFMTQDGSIPPREFAGTVEISKTAVDTVLAVSGLFDPYGALSDDTMLFDYYGGVLFSRATTFPDTYFGYHLAAGAFNKADQFTYLLNEAVSLFGFVDEGYIACVSALSPDFEFTGFSIDAYESSAFTENDYYATLGGVYDILLVDPSTAKFLPAAGHGKTGLSSKDFKSLELSLRKARTNYVETTTGYIKSTIDRMWAEKRAAKAAAAQAPSTGKVRFSHSDVELVRVK